MSKVRHTKLVDSLIGWMTMTMAAAERGEPVVLGVTLIKTWRDAMLTLREDTQRREMEIITAESRLEDGTAEQRIDAIYAAHTAKLGVQALQRIAERVGGGVNERDFVAVIDALETLAMGIARPVATTNPKPTNPKQGA
ncbi:hypothetical protein ABI_08870 [Asticcacaulis biprosthecium C19]|uniref:Uncharacterized protein n=1 Tax=Asticcacaulis biprosthecium C19 TaxID=715226 RepID=F4QGC3_9CAUL|nr:hypothetical protein [Asticcacaulis biprosthecium]EGF92451.1 hypothetical protein ABI_08870 [Asticcacaulis biprosthecium C19]